MSADPTQHVYLVDGQGRIVAHSDPSAPEPLSDVSASPPVAALLAAPTASAARAYDGQEGERLVAYAPIEVLGWGVFVERSSADALRAFRAGREATLAVLLLALAAAIVCAIAFAHRLERPVRSLADAARRLASGEASVTLPAAGIRELDALAADFAVMQADVLAREEALSWGGVRHRCQP